MEVPVTILRPGPSPHPGGGGGAGTLLAIDDRDKETLASDPVVQEAFQRDWLVVEVDPRGFGELTVQEPGWVFATSLLLGENFVWRQAWDVHFSDIVIGPVHPNGVSCRQRSVGASGVQGNPVAGRVFHGGAQKMYTTCLSPDIVLARE